MMPESENLAQIVKGLASGEKEVREAAEQAYEREWLTRAGMLFPCLLEVIAHSPERLTKSVAAVLLRKAVLRDAAEGEGCLWERMDGSGQEQCRGMLLSLFASEGDAEVQHRLGDAVAEVARVQIRYGSWPELLGMLAGCKDAGRLPGSQVLSLIRVLGAVPELVEGMLGGGEGLQELVQLVQSCLQVTSGEIRVETLRSLSSMLYVLGDDDASKTKQLERAFAPTIGAAADIVRSLSEEADEQADAILCLADLAAGNPKLFKAAWGPLAGLMVQLTGAAELDEDVRKSSVELLMTLLETVKAARKDAGLLGTTLHCLITLVAEVPADASEWLADPEGKDEAEAEELSSLGEISLDRLALAVGGEALMPHLQAILPVCMQSGEWRMRYAGLRTLASVAEGCMDVLEDVPLEQTLSLVWPSLGDANPRVQHSACHALGQLCTDFDGALQASPQGLQALGALCDLLASTGHARVQAHAAAALINFAEGVLPEDLAPHLQVLLSRLAALLSVDGQPAYLRGQLLATLGAFASAAGPAFLPYYQAIAPGLLAQISTYDLATAPPSVLGRAIEAMSLIVYSLGREHVPAADLDALLNAMLKLQQQAADLDAELKDLLSLAWARLCRVLGPDAAPVLPLLIPGLLERAAQEAEVASHALKDGQQEEDEEGWQWATVRGRRLGIRTAGLEDKLDAMQDLLGYVQALGQAYQPVAQETLRVAHAALSFSLHEGVQAAAAELLAALLPLLPPGSVDLGGIAEGLLAACTLEQYSGEYACAALDALAEMMAPLAAGLGTSLAQAVIPALQSLLDILGLPEHKRRDADEDEEEEDDDEDEFEQEEREEVIYSLSRFMAALLRAYGPTIAPGLTPVILFCAGTAIPSTTSDNQRHGAICILDDILHWSGPDGTAAHAQLIAKALTAAIMQSGDSDLRQAGLFGLGMAAEHGGPSYAAWLAQAPQNLLLPLLGASNAKAPSQADVTDNAASALARILTAQPELCSEGNLKAFLSAFPVVHDSDEIAPCYRFLRDLIRSQRLRMDGAALGPLVRPALELHTDPFEKDLALRADLATLLN